MAQQIYSVKDKKKFPLSKIKGAYVEKNARGGYMLRGETPTGNSVCQIMSQANAEAAIEAGQAEDRTGATKKKTTRRKKKA